MNFSHPVYTTSPHFCFCDTPPMALRDQDREFRHPFVWKLNEKFVQSFHNYFYRYVTRRLGAGYVLFLNYGYEEDPPMGVPLSASDEPNRFSIQLYHRT